jgi:tetratricopeptide (TPR) repeat protein
MLRSIVENNGGRAKEAIIYLEQADKQLPDSVAVKALLATMYMDDGSYIAADLQLLGPDYRMKARQAALEIREKLSHRIPNARSGWYHELLAFHTGLLNADQLLEKAGELRSNQCEAHYYIGLRKLAEGKRTEAKACFKRASETNCYMFPECCWSRAFLARIDDPAWLPWIPMTK